MSDSDDKADIFSYTPLKRIKKKRPMERNTSQQQSTSHTQIPKRKKLKKNFSSQSLSADNISCYKQPSVRNFLVPRAKKTESVNQCKEINNPPKEEEVDVNPVNNSPPLFFLTDSEEEVIVKEPQKSCSPNTNRKYHTEHEHSILTQKFDTSAYLKADISNNEIPCNRDYDKYDSATISIDSQLSQSLLKDLPPSNQNVVEHAEHSSSSGIKVEMDYNLKVRSWLDQYIDEKIEEDVSDTNSIEKLDSSVSKKVKHSKKSCIHLHFHFPDASSPYVQTTLDKFFPSISLKKGKESDITSNSNGNNALASKSWKEIFNRNAKKLSCTPSTSSSVTFPEVKSANNFRKKCPFYKRIEDTTFAVDAFSYGIIDGVTDYFLSHFHYDHYRGLNRHFKKPVYCSEITANLIRSKLKLPEEYLKTLPLEESRVIRDVEVTVYDANHCPGAIMFVFRLMCGKTILHVGDFRAHRKMTSLCNELRGLDLLYLDTTYMYPDYSFASQEDVLTKCVEIAISYYLNNTDILFIVGSYSIGKERVFKSIAQEINSKIFCSKMKEGYLRCLDDNVILQRLTSKKSDASVHVLPMTELQPLKIRKYLACFKHVGSTVVVFKPSGWTHNQKMLSGLHNIKPVITGNIHFFNIPYSEHSSYSELEWFVKTINPQKVIPTVNVQEYQSMKDIISGWCGKN